jgi:hypothetical protein
MSQTVASLKAEAARRTGMSDFGDPWFEQPLAAWAMDLDGAQLNDRSRIFLGRLAVTNLCRRLEVVDWLTRHPEINDVAIPPIIYITGMERSGTTLLHNLLSLDPRARALLRWELMRPTPPPEAETFRSDPRIAEVQRAADQLRGTALEHMHWVNADDPEECVWGATDCTGLLGRAASFSMPTWAAWIESADLSPSYREYRQLVKMLLWRNPLPEGGHLVLKCPQHSRDIKNVARAFPESQFVLTHRDPFRTCVSVATLAAGINAPFGVNDYACGPGGRNVAVAIAMIERSTSHLCEFADTNGGTRADVAYPALVSDPVTTVRRIYDALHFDWPDGFDAQIASFLSAQASGKRAKPPAELPTFGLDHRAFLERPAIAAYCRRFDIIAETTRTTGA